MNTEAFFLSHFGPRGTPTCCARWSAEVRWVMWAFWGNSIIIIIIMKALSANQEAPVQARRRGGGGGDAHQRRRPHCVLVAFYKSHGKKGTFWTGSDLTHSHTVLMRSAVIVWCTLKKKKSLVTEVTEQNNNRHMTTASVWHTPTRNMWRDYLLFLSQKM